jgi:hypothetical protein
MASVSGSQLSFFAPGKAINTVLTKDGSGTLTPVAGVFNLEVFTATPPLGTSLAPGFQGSAIVPNATLISGNQVKGGAPNEQLLDGSYTVVDATGNETIQIIGSATGSSDTVVGSKGDTITGSPNSATTQLIDASGTNPGVVPGAMTVIGGAGATTVWGGPGDSIIGGSGALFVPGDADNNMTIKGGTGSLTTFNLGHNNSIVGSQAGFTFIDDNYGGGGNTITGGAGNGPVTTPLNTTVAAGSFIISGAGDQITGGAGSTLVNGLNGFTTVTGGSGPATVWAGAKSSIAGGSGPLSIDGSQGSGDTLIGASAATTISGGTSNTVGGGTGGLTYSGGNKSTVTGGGGNLDAFNLGKNNSITGSSDATKFSFIDDSYANPTAPGSFTGGQNTLSGCAGGATIIAGPGDTVNGGAGKLEAIFRSNLPGNETVNLSSGVAGVRDAPVSGGAGTNVTVNGFTSADVIESNKSVDGTGKFLGSSSVVSGNTILTFLDGTTMTIVGVTSGIKFTT